MSIGDILSALARSGPALARTSGPPGTARGIASIQDIPEAEIMQLTLSNDGIWQVVASPQSDTSFTRTPHRTALQTLRLYPSITHLYAPTGRPQASAPARGLVLDIYA